MDNTYTAVSSNDTLLHLALSSSPESLCGRIVVNHKTNLSASDVALKCDLCDTLSGGSAFLKYTDGSEAHRHLASDHDIDLDLIPSQILEDEDSLELFHREAHIMESSSTKEAGFFVKCRDCGKSLGTSGDDGEEAEWLEEDHKKSGECPGKTSSVKEAAPRNWTREGVQIVNGFDLVLTTREASEVPFLDTDRVAISEKIHCSGCDNDEWLSRVASCIDCGEFKCDGCMDSSSYDLFMGTCKKCANTSNEEEDYFLNSYDDTDYSTIQRASGFFAEEEYDEEATFLSPEN